MHSSYRTINKAENAIQPEDDEEDWLNDLRLTTTNVYWQMITDNWWLLKTDDWRLATTTDDWQTDSWLMTKDTIVGFRNSKKDLFCPNLMKLLQRQQQRQQYNKQALETTRKTSSSTNEETNKKHNQYKFLWKQETWLVHFLVWFL